MQSGHYYNLSAGSRNRSRSPSPCRHPHIERTYPEAGGSRRRSIELSINNLPVDAHVRVEESPSPSEKTDDIIIQRLRTPTQGLGEMDELAGDIRNYGSFSSSGNVNNTETVVPSATSGDNAVKSSSGNGTNQECQGKPSRLGRQKSYYTPAMVDELRKRNILYFMDPITKLLHFHGFPWKLTLQVIKVVLITVQICIFGGQRSNIVEYFERSGLAYRHLLLKDWDPAYETLPYPPASGPYAIYKMNELFDHMNFAMEQYYKLPDMTLAMVHLNINNNTGMAYPMLLCYRANAFLEYPNGTYVVPADVQHNCTYVHPTGLPDNRTYDIRQYLKEHNFTIQFNRTLELSLKFYLRTFHLNLLQTHYGPTCYNVSLKITYNNNERSGQLIVDLETKPEEIDCHGSLMSPEAQAETDRMKAKVLALDGVVMAICCLSTVLCSRSLKRCNNLRKDTSRFFKLHKGKPFKFGTHMEYINMWYILIIINDILTVIGSSFKMQLESRVFSVTSENYEICSVFLGAGVFLTYVGILRYLGFFKSYNVLILTLKTSFPHVIRFLVCAICLYTGFLFCGWVVFSPYHVKFRKLSTTSECLFSLVNGDDMFATFSALVNNSDSIWYFHRAYLYIFISLFIYVVLSVFIAVIMDNYENLKCYYNQGFPESDIQKFINEDGGMTMTELFRHVQRGKGWRSWFFCIFPCLACLRRRLPGYFGGDQHPLLNLS